MPSCVLPPAERTPGRALPPGQGGIPLSCACSSAQCRLCSQTVRRRGQSTSPSAIVWQRAHGLPGALFPLRALPPVVSSPLLAVFVPLGADAQQIPVFAPPAPPPPGVGAVQLLSI